MNLWRRLTARPDHRHVCACGSTLECSHDADKCRVIEPWACDTCLDEQQEAHFETYARQVEQEARRANHR